MAIPMLTDEEAAEEEQNMQNTYFKGQQGQKNPLNAGAAITTGFQAVGTGLDYYNQMQGIQGIDVQQQNPYQQYSAYSQPDQFQRNAAPEEIAKGTGGRSALNYGGKGATLGMQVGGPLGAAVGAVGGVIGGAIMGGQAKKKRRAWEQRQEELYGNWAGATNRYQSNQRQGQMDLARQQQFTQRGANTIPYFNQSLYGL